MTRPRKENPKVRIQISLEPYQIQGVENTIQKLKDFLKEYGANEGDLKDLNRSWLIREMIDVIGSEAGFNVLKGYIQLALMQKVGK